MRAEEYNGAAAAVGMSARERLNADLRALTQDVNAAFSDLAEAAGQGVADARAKAFARSIEARSRFEDAIKGHPWRTAALVAGVGLALGLLLRRR
jgi:ElaB/YqjD/DUF883 family membrane-anchored ribosome-binding protein